MKKIICTAFAALLFAACYSDKGNYDYTSMIPVEVAGIETSYSRLVRDVNLVIDPTMSTPERFDYCWQIYRDQQTAVLKPDTLALTRKLDMAMDYQLPAGNYRLVFNARDKQTAYTKIVSATLTVTTANSIGWYFTKEQAGRVDMDFFSASGAETPNWIASFNDGLNLQGTVIKTLLLRNYEAVPTDQVATRSLMVVTNSDAAVVSVNEGKVLRSWDNMFYSAPATRNVQNVMLPTGYDQAWMVLDGQVYSMVFGTYSGGAPFAGPITSRNYQFSRFCGVAFTNVAFDHRSGSFKGYAGNTVYDIAERTGAPLSPNNMGAEPVWMESYPSPRFRSLALMHGTDWKLVEMQTDYQYLASWAPPLQNPIVRVATINPTSKMAAATVRGGNFDVPFVYLGTAGELYTFNASDQSETLTWRAPAGEEITLIQHIKYPLAPTDAMPLEVSKVVVATHNAGRYKIWLCAVDNTGAITVPAQPDFEGEGMVRCANWLGSPTTSTAPTDGSIIYY